MGYPTKITTCCYCGARAALVLDASRHELSCASCGAPLHNIKKLPVKRSAPPKRDMQVAPPKAVKKPKKVKKKKSWRFKDALEDIFDLVEDILD